MARHGDTGDPLHVAIDSGTVTIDPTGLATSAQIGEVQASPTTNTLLDRLKTLATSLTSLLAVEGATGDAVVAAGAAGSISAKLRAISRDLVANIVLAAGSNVIGRVGHDTTVLSCGGKNVTTSGSEVALKTTTAAKWVIITARPGNSGKIVVGDASVVATAGSEVGAVLSAGDAVTLLIDDLAEVFIDATVNGEGVSFTYGT